jgi:hypothetical protein
MAIDRDLGRRRDAPMPSPGRRGQAMRSPGTIDDRARDIAPDGVPFNFYDSGRMDPPSRRFPMPTPPRMPMPMPMPMPSPGPRQPMPMPLPPPREGLPPRPMPMPPPSIPPGMGPFRPQPFPDQMPRGDREFEYFRTPREIMPGENPFPGLDKFMGQGPTMMPAAATIDPSDYRTILKLIEQGLDPEDYMNRGGIASLLQ